MAWYRYNVDCFPRSAKFSLDSVFLFVSVRRRSRGRNFSAFTQLFTGTCIHLTDCNQQNNRGSAFAEKRKAPSSSFLQLSPLSVNFVSFNSSLSPRTRILNLRVPRPRFSSMHLRHFSLSARLNYCEIITSTTLILFMCRYVEWE